MGYWKSVPIFVGNVLVQVRHVFLSDSPLVLSLFKPKGVGVFWNKKKSGPNRKNPLNSSIDIQWQVVVSFNHYLLLVNE